MSTYIKIESDPSAIVAHPSIAVKQEIKEENELIIDSEASSWQADATPSWHYPFKLDEEEQEYKQKYERLEDSNVHYEVSTLDYIDGDDEVQDDACDEGENENTNDADYAPETDGDASDEGNTNYLKDGSTSNDLYVPNVKQIDTLVHHDYAAIVCHLCRYKFSRCYKWTKHMEQAHHTFIKTVQASFEYWTDSASTCRLCNTQLRHKSNQILHSLVNHALKPNNYLLCTICGYQDCRVTSLKDHLRQKHPERVTSIHKCPLCSLVFKTQVILQFHFMEIHVNEYKEKYVYHCHLCEHPNFDSDHYEEYLQHLMSEHNLNTMEKLDFQKLPEDETGFVDKCQKCFKLFVRKPLRHLLAHYLTHETTCTWTCKYCHKEYIYQDLKSLHMCTEMIKFCRKHNRKESNLNVASLNKQQENEISVENIQRDMKDWQVFETCIEHICPFCNKEFAKFHLWQIHLRERHQINTLDGLEMSDVPNEHDKLQCIKCYAFITKSTIDLHTHRFQHLPFKPYKCRRCCKALMNYETALEHLQKPCDNTHKGQLIKTDSETRAKRAKISKYFDDFMQISCVLCYDLKFATADFLATHYQTVHGNFKKYFVKSDKEDETICKICCYKIPRLDRHTGVGHFLQHLEEKPYKCLKCQRSQSLYRRCKFHITKCHPNVQKMESAENKDSDASELHDYITYVCPECNLSQPTFKIWEKHIKENHKFFDKSNIAYVDSSDGKYKCKECSATLSTSTPQQQQHKLTHMPFKAFICLLCHNRLNSLKTLLRHVRVRHFSEGSFKCLMCKKKNFVNDFERIEHIRHSHPQWMWPRKMCVLCFQSFRDLKKHAETHEINRNKFNCEVCRIGIIHLKDYEGHMWKKHNRKISLEKAAVVAT